MTSDTDLDPPTISQAQVSVWDSRALPLRDAFENFREGVCKTFMPWSIEQSELSNFHCRIESLATETGSVAHCTTNAFDARRTSKDLSNSAWDCVYGNYVLSGSYEIEQFGHTTTAHKGDLILYDSATALSAKIRPSQFYADVPIMIHKGLFASNIAEQLVGNIVVRQSELIRPIESSLNFLADNILTLPPDELSAVFEAFARMLPAALNEEYRNPQSSIRHEVAHEIVNYISREISNPNLCPAAAAAHLGISVRYVHKLFAKSGTTFSAHVSNQRLDRIYADLICASNSSQLISTLIFRWGYNDLSTFNRQFRKRFGMTPTECRAGRLKHR